MQSRGGRRRTSATVKNHRELRDYEKDTIKKTIHNEKTTGNLIVPRLKEPSSEKPDITPGIRNTKNLATTTPIRGTQVTEEQRQQNTTMETKTEDTTNSPKAVVTNNANTTELEVTIKKITPD